MRRLSGLHEQLLEIVHDVSVIDFRGLEGESSSMIHDALHGRLLQLLDRSLDLLGRITRHFDGESSLEGSPSGGPRDYDLGVDTLVEQWPSAGRIVDLSCMASMELRAKRAGLAAFTAENESWLLLSALDSARRRIGKSLTAVEIVLCGVQGVPATLDYASEVSSSLEVRRAYARLRKSIREARPPTDSDIESRLRNIKIEIAILIGRPVYQVLRVEDRMLIRSLQQRVLAWLRTPINGARSTSGRRLWEDLSGFARLTELVSQRQELIGHDARVMKIAAGILRDASRAEIPEPLFGHLLSLQGLDREIDGLLEANVLSTHAWRKALERRNGPSEQGHGELIGVADE